MTAKTNWQKFWHFLWHSNSILSWVVNVVLAFVLIKYLLYPGIGLVLGTQLPVVAVISESMEHPRGDDWLTQPANCERGPCTQEAWYIHRDISSKDFKEFPFSNGFNKGDIMLLVGEKTEDINIGEIIVFSSGKSYPIIHRVIERTETEFGIKFETKGDNNPSQITVNGLNERNIKEDDIIGVAKVRVPYLGFIKIWFTHFINLLR